MVGTAMACHNPSPRHPFGGTLSSVAVDTAQRGKGLGYVVSAAATARLLQGGYVDIYMETDDWRLPALKTYFKMGWVPFLYREGMSKRWELVCRQLGLAFTPGQWREV